MQRAVKLMLSLVGSIAVLCGGLVVLRGSIPPALNNAWLPAGNLTAVRASAGSVLLQDGRLLVTGGNDASGPLASTEILDTSGNFAPGPSMNFARSNHVAVTMLDGRVLVAGGTGADGRPTDTAEIFDPASNTWSMAGLLLVPRSGATATLLPDGRLVIAGGISTGGPTNTLEIYDPASGNFTAAAGVLSSARQNHAAALLPGGQVLIVGGSDGTQALATSDLFDPSNGSVSLGPVLQTARSGLTATTLLDGSVLVAGGTTTAQDGSSQDLASLEILSPGSGGFTLAPASLASPRSGQAAFLLPHNNGVLLVGGTSNGTILNSSELYLPWAGAFGAPATLASPRNLLTGSPLATDGLLLVAGGSDGTNTLATTEVYGFATVRTDKADYVPGEIVTITGTGWQPGETVTLSLVELPLIDTPTPVTAVADANGNILNTQFSPDQYDLGVRFYLTALGGVSQAQTTFTDNKNVTVAFAGTGSGSVANSVDSNTCTDNGGTASGSGCTVSAPNTGTVTLTATATSPSSIGSWTVPSGYAITSGTCTTGNSTCTFTLDNNSRTVTVAFNAGAAAQYLVTSNNNSPVAGAGVTITAQLADSGGNPVHTSGKIVTWSSTNGGSFGSATSTTNANGVATVSFTTNTVAGTVHTVTATDNTSVTGTSGNITTVAGALDHFVFDTISSPQTAGTAFNITITAQDANNNTATSFSGGGNHVSLTSTGALSGAPVTTPAFTNGVLSSYSVTITNTGNFTITATAPGTPPKPTGTSNSFTVNPGPVSSGTSTVAASPTSVVADNTTTSTITVTLKDANGNPVSGKTVSLAAGSGSSAISAASGPSDSSGVVTFTVKDAAVESVTYTAKDTTDNTTITQTATVNFTVGPVSASASTVVASPGSVPADNTTTSTITVTLMDGFSHPVSGKTVSLAAGSGSSTISAASGPSNASGVVTFTVKDAAVESVTYTGKDTTDNTTITQTATVNFTSVSVNTSTMVASSANPSVFGQSVTFTAAVAAASGNVAPTGNVQFVVDGSNYGAPVALGACSPAVPATACASTSDSALSVTTHTVTANYLGVTGFNTSSGSLSPVQTVNRADTTTAVGTISPEPSLVGESYSVAYTVAPVSPGSGTPTGNVTVDDGDGHSCTATVAAGSCSLTSTSIGTKTITATYASDTNFNGSHGTKSHVVSLRPTSTTVTSVSPASVPLGVGATVSVTVTDTGTGTASNPGGTIAFTTSGSGTFGTCTLASSGADSATCTATYTPSGTVSGTSRTDTIKASFTATDSTHENSSDATGKVLTVTKRSTSTTVTSLTPDSVVVAQSTSVVVTVTDTETGTTSNPAGTVSLASTGTGTFGTCTLAPSGADAATCTVNYTPSDALTSPQTITASFTATDSVHKDSADTTGKNLTVTRRMTSTAVALTPSSVVTGQSSSVAVTVTDTESAGTAQYPTGTVTVTSSDANDLFTGTCTLGATATAGVSSCAVSVQPPHVGTGTHTISASFSQTGVHLASSKSADLTVSKANTSITGVTATPEPSVLGASYAVNWTLSVVSPGSGTPTGTVNVSDGHGNTCSATAPAATCTISTSTVAGPLTLTVNYLGDNDFNGATGSGTHTISFNFLGLFDPYAPPPRGYKVKSAVPLKWQYADVNGVVVNSSNANPAVQIYVAGACGGADTGDILDIQASGNSGYQYDPTTSTWQFNWKTTGMAAGCYNVYIKSNLTGQVNGPFPIQLVR